MSPTLTEQVERVGLQLALEMVKSRIVPEADACAAFDRGDWGEWDSGWNAALESLRDELVATIEARSLS